jgi:hypothetical protein
VGHSKVGDCGDAMERTRWRLALTTKHRLDWLHLEKTTSKDFGLLPRRWAFLGGISQERGGVNEDR